jgi:uncharacterized protein YfaS (alpha-2-macroglobulin family)
MRSRQGCGLVVLSALFLIVACLIFLAFAAALVFTGEVPIYAPRLTNVQPHPNFAFQPTTSITLTFDQPMDAASVEAAFALEPAVPGSYHWNEGSTRVTFVPDEAGYLPGTSYTARLEAGAKAATLPRTTTRSVEWGFSLPPLLDTMEPVPGQEGLGSRVFLRATFGYPLDCRATFQTFSITPDAAGILGCKGYTFTFSPTVSFEADTAYVASLENVYLEGDSWPRPGVRWEFRTAPALTVEEVEPRHDGFLNDLFAFFRITFNRPVLADSAAARFSLVTQDGTPVPGQLTWEQGGAGLVFQPDEPLRPATEYQLTLLEGVQDQLGFELAKTLERSYTTLPMLGLPLPVPGSTDVALDSEIRVPFTRPMDRGSVEAGLVISPALDGRMTWDEDTLVFAPLGGLIAETAYQVTLPADVRDASGAPLAESRQWMFVTQAFLLDTQIPSEAIVTELVQPIELGFALPMDRVSVDSALTISPTTPGNLIWSDDGRMVAFQPDPGWLPSADYEITLAGSARTADGYQTMGEDRTFTFSTAMAEIQFGEGPNVQVMGADGQRTFQMVARGADVADFRLYSITPEQFLGLYSSGFRGIGPEEPRVVDTMTLTPTVEWREALMSLDQPGYGDWQPAEAHVPSDVPAGMYVLSAEPPSEEQGQLLVVLTNHALVLKRSLAGSGARAEAQVVAWDTELSSSAPVVSATVRLYDREGTLLAEGLSDADGLLILDALGDPGPLLALADKDGDVTVCGLGNEWGADGWWWWAPPPSRPLYLAYSYTDRPIYRPAQTIYFKDLVRADDDVRYDLPPPDLPITVRLRDARDNVAASQVLTPTQFGTVHGEFQLAEESMLGIWNLETEVDGTVSRQPLKVEEYRKPEYEVLVHTPQETYVHGEAISLTVDASYYFGEPVAGADLVLRAYPLHKDFHTEGESPFGYPVFSEEGRTDAKGRWTTTLSTGDLSEGGTDAGHILLALEATVTDATGQSVSSYETVVVQPTSQGLTLILDKYGYQPNEEVTFSAVVHDRNGEPVDQVELTATVVGWDQNELTTATAFTDEAGQAGFSVRLAEQGWYELRLTGTDDGALVMQAEEYIWVYDPAGQAPWYRGRWSGEPTLSISADQETYAVGEEAQFVVCAPLPGPALLTFERGETRYAQPITLISGTNLISIPVRSDFAPNIYVTINQFGLLDSEWETQSRPEAQLHTASTQLLVPMSDWRLTVALTSEQEIYAPGDEATFRLQVTDYQGQPVVAEVSVAMVDEAIYALAEDVSIDPFEAFYGPRPNLVRTFDSLRPARWLIPEGPGLGGNGVEAGAPRRDFLDTAYWAPVVITDERGGATVTVELPDSLTEWRVLARAVTTDTLVGQATAQIVVSQDVVVRPVVPRFLVQGDALSVGAVVHNFTAQPVSATVQLELAGLTLEGDESQVIHVVAGGSTTAVWPVVAEEPGQVSVTVRTTASRGARLVGRDAVELSLPVYPLAVPEVRTWAGELTPSRPTSTLTLTVPADAVAGLSHLRIDLAPSLAPGLLEGLEYLVDYPYGCVEQTMSRMLPNAMVAWAFGQLGIRNELLEADLPHMMDLGLQKLYGYQHNDGGWGWWYDDSTDVNQTAYVLFGLTMTEQAGFDVDDGVAERGTEALRRLLPGADPRAEAYGIYVLAMAGQQVTSTFTLTDALQLDLFSQAALVMGLEAAVGNAAGPGSQLEMVTALLDNLREAAIQDDGMVHWEEEGEDIAYSRTVMGSAVRTTAMVIDALIRLDPQSPLLPGAVRWLMAQRQGQGWGDTQKSSYAIMALTDYLLASQDLTAGSAYRVYLNGGPWHEGVLGQADQGESITVPMTALLPAENDVALVLGAEGDVPSGRIYYALTLDVSRAQGDSGTSALEPHERSIGIRREYRPVGSQEPATQFQQGDLVEVHLMLDVPEESWYVVIDDPLPAGFEALNERLGTTSHIAAAYDEPVYYWSRNGYNRKDVHDEQVSFFVSRLGPGEHTFTYMVRAVTAGSFTALPAEVYPMYEPEVWSRSDGIRCQIEMR